MCDLHQKVLLETFKIWLMLFFPKKNLPFSEKRTISGKLNHYSKRRNKK